MKIIQLAVFVSLVVALAQPADAQLGSTYLNVLKALKSVNLLLASLFPNNPTIQARIASLTLKIDAVIAQWATTTVAPELTIGEYMHLIYANYADPVLVSKYQKGFNDLLYKKTIPIAGSAVDAQAITSTYSQSVAEVFVELHTLVVEDPFTINIQVAAQDAILLKAIAVYMYDMEILTQLSLSKIANDPGAAKFVVDYGDYLATIASWSIDTPGIDIFFNNMTTLNHFSVILDEGIAVAIRTKA